MPVDRRGWSLVETVVALALLAIVGGAATSALASGQRSVREASELRALRAELRDAGGLLAGEIRAISALDTVRFAADTAFEFFTAILHGIVCAPGETRLLVIPVAPAGNGAAVAPDTGDVVWIWREDSVIASGRWHRARIAAHAATTNEPCAAAFDDPGAPPRLLELASGFGPIIAGSPVVATRRVRYSIYRGSDGGWYLGYRRCDALGRSHCQTVQPVSGPYRPRSGGRSGLTFRYVDSSGVAITSGAPPWRVEIVAHPDTATRLRRALSPASLLDSVAIAVALRNAR